MREVTGTILDLQRFCVHDGPGIRTTVFLKGCTMRCAWCHRPEARREGPHLAFDPTRCVGCGYCYRACPRICHYESGNGRHIIGRDKCLVCGSCTLECYSGALEVLGREVSAGEILDAVLQDRGFFRESGGGLTLSGGEPTAQPEFSEALLRMAGRAGLHRCLDTSGQCDWDILQGLMPHVDLFLFDYKESRPEHHREFTGVSNTLILKNLEELHRQGARLRLRCPIIPGVNARTDHFRAIAALAARLPGIEGIEILPHYPLLNGSRLREGDDDGNECFSSREPSRADVREWILAVRRQLGRAGLDPGLLVNEE